MAPPRDLLSPRLLPATLAMLRRVGQSVAACGQKAWLVGGPVRDALLGRPVLDLDVVVEGNALELARTIVEELPEGEAPATQDEARAARESLALFPEFLTARLDLPGGLHLDLITARSETYEHPGALPTVKPADLDADLRRRDFTVNAMAASLMPEDFGRLFDPLDGYAALRFGVLKALHDQSFRDDPTRVVRAATYSERLASRLEKKTQRWLAAAIAEGALEWVAPQRHGEQLRRALLTDAGGRILLRLAEWGCEEALGLPRGLWRPAAVTEPRWGRKRLGLTAADLAQATFALAAGPSGPQAGESLALGREYGQAAEKLVG
ncbi:MAG: CCA tRNA nucleotidyltransferase, partial [Armatimonadetes bacterium]|nr:CCA tRNA nucleotidyltransferase [Armatimonadota bacterium]